ncbi:MAG: hypothetical protein IT462_15645 [Planctomycetes bacterium]|nr:hypothetical protein [Planctomycetota bacterium]
MYIVPWLKFLRISALPSALADVFGGVALVAALYPPSMLAHPTAQVWSLVLTTTGIYLGGMGLNDILHVHKDRTLGKNRPLAQREISFGGAISVTVFLYVAGLAGAWLAGCFWPALALALLTAVYNSLASVSHPRRARAAAGMAVLASCRALHVSLPLWSFSGGQLPQGAALPVILMFVSCVFVYFLLVTLVSLFEDSGGGIGVLWFVQFALLPVVFTLPVFIWATRPISRPFIGVVIPLLIAAGLIGRMHRVLKLARREPTARHMGKVVGSGLRGECLLMAALGVAVAPDAPWWGLGALGFYPVASALSLVIKPQG